MFFASVPTIVNASSGKASSGSLRRVKSGAETGHVHAGVELAAAVPALLAATTRVSSTLETFVARDGDTGARVLHAIIGVLSVIVGFALLRSPFQSVEVFIFVIGILFLVQGIMTFIAAFAVKQGRIWRIIMGILGVVAGIVVLTWPISSAVTLAFIAGIWLVILGILQIIMGFQLRRARSA